ncbi:DUF6090 family protein [Bizionia hallyeonensis]|uniref:DUF6090 family protein n=1 Tax=Bizionia hallyeonensis TaxID=1123757 RepID=A0ABW0CAC8_9FLAO
MIKFFRKIRQNLLSEGKTGKYLKYAVGEIVLVVIGILIALQINNANENRKTNGIKKEYYRQILVDLDKEIDNINTRIIALDSSITSSDNYFKNFKTADLQLNQLIDELCKVEYTFQYVYFNTNTIQTLESTGDIKLIPENIRNSLIELKRRQDRISLAAGNNYDIYLNAHEKALQLGFPRLRFQASKANELGLENKFAEIILTSEGSLMLKNYTDKMVKRFLIDMLIEVNKIKEMITVELKEK